MSSELETKEQSANSGEKLTGHQYDGIQEYDNPLPAWWTWLFVLSVVFAGCYFGLTLLAGNDLSARGMYDRAVAEDLKRSGELHADAKTLMKLISDQETLATGAAIFATNCAQCHNRDGSGLVGPNLTDDYYLDVHKIDDIPDVVSKGRNNGAMPAWGNRLNGNEVVQVSAFVASLRGQNKPTQGTRPLHEGTVIPPWSE